MVELNELVSHQELELWSAPVATTSENENPIDEQEVLEFDQIIQDLSDDGTASLGSSIEEKRPDSMEFECQTIEMMDLNSQGEPEIWSANDDSAPNSDFERPLSSDCADYEYFYEQRQMAADVKQRKTSEILREKVEVFDELDRKARKRVEAVEEETDWGTLGVKFENRGVVRDLVWMWEYNHLQQSGRRGVYPDLDKRPKIKGKKCDRTIRQIAATTSNQTHSNRHKSHHKKKQRRRERKSTQKWNWREQFAHPIQPTDGRGGRLASFSG